MARSLVHHWASCLSPLAGFFPRENRSRTRRNRRSFSPLSVEALESRSVPSTFEWAGSIRGLWGDAQNWLKLDVYDDPSTPADERRGVGVPGEGDDAAIGQQGSSTDVVLGAHHVVRSIGGLGRVALSDGGLQAARLSIFGQLSLSGVTLTTQDSHIRGPLSLANSDWKTATLSSEQLTITGATLHAQDLAITDGVFVSGGATLRVDETVNTYPGAFEATGSGTTVSCGRLSNGGNFTLSDGASLHFNDTSSITDDWSISSGASLAVDHDLSVRNLVVDGSTTQVNVGGKLAPSSFQIVASLVQVSDLSLRSTAGDSVSDGATLEIRNTLSDDFFASSVATLTVSGVGTKLKVGQTLDLHGTLNAKSGASVHIGATLKLTDARVMLEEPGSFVVGPIAPDSAAVPNTIHVRPGGIISADSCTIAGSLLNDGLLSLSGAPNTLQGDYVQRKDGVLTAAPSSSTIALTISGIATLGGTFRFEWGVVSDWIDKSPPGSLGSAIITYKSLSGRFDAVEQAQIHYRMPDGTETVSDNRFWGLDYQKDYMAGMYLETPRLLEPVALDYTHPDSWEWHLPDSEQVFRLTDGTYQGTKPGRSPAKNLLLIVPGTAANAEGPSPQNPGAWVKPLAQTMAADIAKGPGVGVTGPWDVAVMEWKEFDTGTPDDHVDPDWKPWTGSTLGINIGESLGKWMHEVGLSTLR